AWIEQRRGHARVFGELGRDRVEVLRGVGLAEDVAEETPVERLSRPVNERIRRCLRVGFAVHGHDFFRSSLPARSLSLRGTSFLDFFPRPSARLMPIILGSGFFLSTARGWNEKRPPSKRSSPTTPEFPARSSRFRSSVAGQRSVSMGSDESRTPMYT